MSLLNKQNLFLPLLLRIISYTLLQSAGSESLKSAENIKNPKT